MADIATIEPKEITAGSTIQWTKSLSDYLPADGWVLSYSIYNANNQYTVTATDNGDGTHLVNIDVTTSTAYAQGDYQWQAYVTKAAERFDVECGEITINPNAAAGVVDGRSHVKKTLDAINATIEGRATSSQQSYSVDGVSVSRLSMEELITAKEKYNQWYQQEKDAANLAKGLGGRGIIRVQI